jgi:hypothetical protein
MRADGQAAPQLSDPRPQTSFGYDAFISYDHDDRAVAQGIQRGLHQIGKRLGQLRALRVFRDPPTSAPARICGARSPTRWTTPAI